MVLAMPILKSLLLSTAFVAGPFCFAQVSEGKITYYLEKRVDEPSWSVRKKPAVNGRAVYNFAPGDLIRVDIDAEGYNARLRAERAGKGTWVRVNAAETEGTPLEAYVYDHWKAFATADPSQQPVQLTFEATRYDVITVFSRPGFSSWRSCLDHEGLCIGWPNREGELKLIDTVILTDRTPSRLYYKVAYTYMSEEKGERKGEGWVPAAFLKRKIGKLPVIEMLASGRAPAGLEDSPIVSREVASELIRKTEESTIAQMSLSQASAESLRNRFSRWTTVAPANNGDETAPAAEGATTRAQSSPPLFNFKIDFDIDIRAGIVDLQKTNPAAATDAKVTQDALRFGFSGIAPILLDLEAAGTLEYARGMRRLSGNGDTADMIGFEQHVLYTLPSPPGSAIKMGLGWNLLALTRGGDQYGMKAAVGARYVAMYESARGFGYLKAGPAANSSGVSFKNHEWTLGGGLRLKPSLGYQSWALTGEVFRMSLTSKLNNDKSDIWTYFLGARRTF